MATIVRFEDIQAWGKARTLVRELYRITEEGVFAKDYALPEQLRRAGISIMSNIAEGFARRTSKEFRNLLNVAHGSAAEAQAQLYIALDLGYISEKQFSTLYKQAEEVSKMTRGFMDHLKEAGSRNVPVNSQLSTHNS